MIALPDVNVLLALNWNDHIHHDAAHEWFGELDEDGWATCAFTQSAFVRLSLNPQIVGENVAANDVIEMLRQLTAHPQHQYLDSIPPMTAHSIDEVARRIRAYRQVTDAILLHTARSNGVRLVTFDQPIRALNPWDENLEVLVPT